MSAASGAWKAEWAVTRTLALTAEERQAVATHVQRWRRDRLPDYDAWLADGASGDAATIVWGDLVLPDDAHAPEVEALLEALSELRGLVAGAACIVADEHQLIGWDEAAGSYVLGGVPDEPTGARGEVVATRASTLAPAKQKRTARAATVPTTASLPDGITRAMADVIEPLLAPLADADKKAHRPALTALAAHDAIAVARLAVRALARTKKPRRLIDAVVEALSRLAGVSSSSLQGELERHVRALPDEVTASVRADLLDLWAVPGPRSYDWWSAVDRLSRLFLDDQRIVAQAFAAVAGPRQKRDEGRITSGLIVLGSLGTPAAVRAIVRCLRADRGRCPDDDATVRAMASLGGGGGGGASERAPWREVALHQLRRMKTPLCWATVSLELAEPEHSLNVFALAALVELFGERADPWRRRLYETSADRSLKFIHVSEDEARAKGWRRPVPPPPKTSRWHLILTAEERQQLDEEERALLEHS
jgi:hypothetical protein